MNSVYDNEYDEGWEAVEPNYGFLNAPTWTPPKPGETTWSDAAAITEEQHTRLAKLREEAGGWFYLKDGQLVFVTIEQWSRVAGGSP